MLANASVNVIVIFVFVLTSHLPKHTGNIIRNKGHVHAFLNSEFVNKKKYTVYKIKYAGYVF